MGLSKRAIVVALSAGCALTSSYAFAKAVPVGHMRASQSMTATIVFKVQHKKQLKRFIRQTVTPSSANYHKFLTTAQFRARYTPNVQNVKQVKHYLNAHGFRVEKTFGNRLGMKVRGPVGAFEHTFNVRIMNFQQSQSRARTNSRQSFHRPMQAPSLSAVMRRNNVLGVVGLSNQYKARSMRTSTSQLKHSDRLQPAKSRAKTIATGIPGQYTVGDVANIYNVNPLYQQGIKGAGKTVGIATLADFLPSDARTYWNTIGLTYKPNRITKVDVDGGAEFGADAGTGETSLDVEQAGGLAPFADVIVYDAPNSLQGTIDLFFQIVSENRADSVSYSWGQPEVDYLPQLNGGVDYRYVLNIYNTLFMQAAAQGISLFTASGDSGAYDTNRSAFPYPLYSKVLTVDAPASLPYITASGGTTLPVSLVGTCSDGSLFPININKERAWGYDYLASFYQKCFNESPTAGGLFAGGAGGGVSVIFPRPNYQHGVAGIRKTQRSQGLLFDFIFHETLLRLPSGYAGRNVPDISMNADPETGYLIYSTPDGGLISGYGGTSFVAPQLNGITALIAQRNGGRLGLLNPQLYRLLKQYGYGGNSPFHDIVKGDIWFWHGVAGYDDATGVGTPDAAKLAAALNGG